MGGKGTISGPVLAFFGFHEFILCPPVVKYTNLSNRVGIGNMQPEQMAGPRSAISGARLHVEKSSSALEFQPNCVSSSLTRSKFLNLTVFAVKFRTSFRYNCAACASTKVLIDSRLPAESQCNLTFLFKGKLYWLVK